MQKVLLIRSILLKRSLFLRTKFSEIKFDKLLSLYLDIGTQTEQYDSFEDEEETQNELIEFTDLKILNLL